MRLVKITPEEYDALIRAGVWVYSVPEPIVQDWYKDFVMRERAGDILCPNTPWPPKGWHLYTKV